MYYYFDTVPALTNRQRDGRTEMIYQYRALYGRAVKMIEWSPILVHVMSFRNPDTGLMLG